MPMTLQPAASAVTGANPGLVAADEDAALLDLRGQHEVQVRGVDVAVGQDRLPCQDCERSGDHRLAGPALAADDGELFHPARPATIARTRANSSRNSARRSGKVSTSGSPRE